MYLNNFFNNDIFEKNVNLILCWEVLFDCLLRFYIKNKNFWLNQLIFLKYWIFKSLVKKYFKILNKSLSKIFRL
jgi:hypothetical protein